MTMMPDKMRIGSTQQVSEITPLRLFSTVLSSLPAFVYSCRSRHTPLSYISDSVREVTGRTKAQLSDARGMSIHELVSPADQHRVDAEIAAALDDTHAFEVVYRLRDQVGEEKWVHERGRGIYTPDGKLNAIEGIVIDITQAHCAEEALRRRVEAYALVSDMSRRFLSLDVSEFHVGIVSALADISVLAGANEARLMESTPDGESLVCTYSSGDGVALLHGNRIEGWRWLSEQHCGCDYFVVRRVEALPDSANVLRQ